MSNGRARPKSAAAAKQRTQEVQWRYRLWGKPAPSLTTLGGLGGCWCGLPSGHDWPGRAIGLPHPRYPEHQKETAMPSNYLPDSDTQHGTLAGWSRHRRDGTPQCDLCYEARRIYDAERAPKRTPLSKVSSKAYNIAYKKLREAHPNEFAFLYEEAKENLFLEITEAAERAGDD